MLHLHPATVALFGAGLLLLVSGIKDPHHVLAEAEWATIFFLHRTVHYYRRRGEGRAHFMDVRRSFKDYTGESFRHIHGCDVVFRFCRSAFIDNIPYVATMILSY